MITGLVVRAIREADRGLGLASTHGASAYGRLAWLASGLHQAVEDEIAALAAGRALTVVDLGAGPGDLLARLGARMPTATLVGIEPSSAMRELAAARGLREIDGRAEQMPLPDASVDVLVSTLSSHHWADPVAAFREIRRVLRPGKLAAIYDVRFAGYGRAEATRIARAAGFAPTEVDHRVLPVRVVGLRPYACITLARQTEGETLHG